jgi:hypothetical protein
VIRVLAERNPAAVERTHDHVAVQNAAVTEVRAAVRTCRVVRGDLTVTANEDQRDRADGRGGDVLRRLDA